MGSLPDGRHQQQGSSLHGEQHFSVLTPLLLLPLAAPPPTLSSLQWFPSQGRKDTFEVYKRDFKATAW